MLTRTQKRKLRFLIILTAVAIVAAGAWNLYNHLQYRRAAAARYPEFGISIPAGYSIHGIDVSKYQYSIAWSEVKAMKVKDVQPGFAFIKATEGIGSADPQFRRNWKRSKEAGMVRGAYHFFIASKDGRMQAENFIDKVELKPGDLPPVLDIEQLNGVPAAEMRKEVKKWLSIAETHYGITPIIYTNADFYNNYLGNEFDNYPLWVAHYYEPYQPRISRNWLFWQHSDEGRVNGILSPVDFNVFNGDSASFKLLLVR